nr:NAD(P)-binding protein [Rubritepida sp.]
MRRLGSVGALRAAYDVAIVGAGPAGLAAAATCAQGGLDVLLLDENTGMGGQVYRGVERAAGHTTPALAGAYDRGAALAAATESAALDALFGAAVWHLDP